MTPVSDLLFDTLHTTATGIFTGALAACNIESAFDRRIKFEGNVLRRQLPDGSGPEAIDLSAYRRIFVVALGKAAEPMLEVLLRKMKRRKGVRGICCTNQQSRTRNWRFRYFEAGHPLPNEESFAAARTALALLRKARKDTLAIFLISGGGSALFDLPLDPAIGLEDTILFHQALLASGAPIGEINTVRKHLSRIKGGRLARAGQRAEIVTLAISDVPHDDPSAIASGPTVPDPTTLADARAIVAKYRLDVDDAIRRALDDARNESCKPGDAAFARAGFELIATPKASLDAAIKVAASAGYATLDLGADLEGEARDVAAGHARLALKARAEGKRVAILSGGELTVTVRGQGRGGPNQEYALALAAILKDTPNISALAADTDGADGGAGSASDPAGAIIDHLTFAKMKSLGLDPAAYLANNDATAFFAATGDLLLTGPTLTNVNDVRVILVD